MSTALTQGDIVRLPDRKELFVVTSNNAYVRATGTLHLCLMTDHGSDGPTHIRVRGVDGTQGVVSCEQFRLIDPEIRGLTRVDHLPGRDVMEISDVIQGLFEHG